MTVAVAVALECVRFQPASLRAEQFTKALMAAARQRGADVRCSDRYRGGSDWLLLWGPGAPDRLEPMRQQLAAGGHVIACDLAYWDREHKVRVSIDAAHPQQWVMKQIRTADRFEQDRLTLEDTWNPDGPVVIAGIGPKALVQYGRTVPDWEQEQIAICRRLHRRILYRPKKPECLSPPGVERRQGGSIDAVLRGASLLVTWHSNAAIDAIRLGIPVVCRDGAAAAVCVSTAADQPRPLPDAWRKQFLANLAWFQWTPQEAGACWRFLVELLTG